MNTLSSETVMSSVKTFNKKSFNVGVRGESKKQYIYIYIYIYNFKN